MGANPICASEKWNPWYNKDMDIGSIKPNDLWYTVGLIASDGNLSPDGRHLNITSKDIDHLQKVKEALRLTVKIGRKGRGGNPAKKYGVLQFGSVVFYRQLQKIGLTPNKSLSLGALKIPKKYFKDYLRGVIDGDGNIYRWLHPQNGNEQWMLRVYTAAPKHSVWLLSEIEQRFKVKGVIVPSSSKPPRNPIYVIKFGKMAARVILNRCYYAESLSLTRKRLLAEECGASYDGWSKSLTINIK